MDRFWSIGEFLWRGLTVTNMWTGTAEWVRLGTNGPIWSLSYEVGFYLLFGSVMFLRDMMRIVILATLLLLLGLPILAMLPSWWIGVLVWRSVSDDSHHYSRAGSWSMAIGSIVVLVAFKTLGVPRMLENFTAAALQPLNHHAFLLYSDEVLWNTIIAVCVALHLIGVWRLARNIPRHPEGAIAKAVRWVAGGSFSLYLVHYPTLHLLDATLPETLPGYNFWLLGLTLATCFGFSYLFERPLKQFRAQIMGLLKRIINTPPARSKQIP